MRLPFRDYDFRIVARNNKKMIFDIVRKKFVSLTPEEWVRQNIIHYLTGQLHYPRTVLSVEKGLLVNRLQKRTDIVVYNFKGQAKMIIECKSPQVSVGLKTLEQAGRYNLALKVPFLVISNYTETFCLKIDPIAGTFTPSDHLPGWKELLGST